MKPEKDIQNEKQNTKKRFMVNLEEYFFKSFTFLIIFKGSCYKLSWVINFEKPLFVNHTVYVSKNCKFLRKKVLQSAT